MICWTQYLNLFFSDNTAENYQIGLEFNNSWRSTFCKWNFFAKLLACFSFAYGAKNWNWSTATSSRNEWIVFRFVHSSRFLLFFFLFHISVRRISGGGSMIVWQEILVNRWLFWIPNFQKLRQLRTSQGRKKKFKVSFVSREASRRPKWTTNCEYNSKFKKLSTQL